ncbi:MAG: transcriptional repressor LexA [Gammaproteobacteria bacterium]|nr:transcriptional repressor LexA [Gammaproteobacteria bacterium]NIR85296.1 transcriptional repressor LexA [Gammaproteobacteria bacterium]NIR88412.1 transcriptional repressor LexA [Gammaproteobacteria bacterium]NIU06362.1 transcriptional repressor LexA [Gammaproteobacteria bacterium]NIV53261.1 transcriptional repressor LexA [Gammaproteobacteria bacterium]
MGERLTRRQQAVLDYLRDHARAHAQAPTLDELCRGLGLRSRGSLHKHVQALARLGLIEPMAGRQRGVRLTERAGAEDVAFVGYIAAGRPIEALENPEPMNIPDLLRSPRRCYVLRVRGDSMRDAGILDGDWVVVEAREHARNGEIVVALVDGEEATLKRIEQRPGAVMLHPANSALEPVSYAPARVQIQGVVVGQMRSYR